MNNHSKILILDFGSQVTQLIARRTRQMSIYSEIKPYSISEQEIKDFSPNAIILSGGSESVTDHNAPSVPKVIYDLNIPILGICYGQQAICQDFGGTVLSSKSRSYGEAKLEIVRNSKLFNGYWNVDKTYKVWMSHGDHISRLPDDFIVIAKTDEAPYTAIQHKSRDIFGIQFHPEVSHTVDGVKLIESFLIQIAKSQRDYKTSNFMSKTINEISTQVKKEKVVLGLSGGVDSTVLAILLHKAIGKQLYCIFIDNGLLRENEVQEVQKNLKDKYKLQIITVDASKNFLSALKGITEPEEKRKIIGKLFIQTFQKTIKAIGNIQYLAQGTICSDVIESSVNATGKTTTIKSHHNVGGLPKQMGNLKLIEPLRVLFKDEVRKLGDKLNIPKEILHRHPFPGPGLAIRVVGEVTEEKCNILRKADHIFINLLKEHNLYYKVWQAYAALLPVKTVGVMGDVRSYEYICVLRAVTSVDGMTADCANLSCVILKDIARKIVNEVKGINRVMYDITSKPPATIEIE